MKAELIIPIDKLRGMLNKEGYYFRMYRGEQIVQRCPTKWKDTPARKAAREKFAQTWGQRYAGKRGRGNKGINKQILKINDYGKSNITDGDRKDLRESRERMFPHNESNGQDLYLRSAE